MSSRTELPLRADLQIRAEMKRRVRETAGIWDSEPFCPICIHPEIPRVSPRFPRSVDTAQGHGRPVCLSLLIYEPS